MKVLDVCTLSVKTCTLESNLASASWLMWEHDCGILPVIDSFRRVIGVITDRDICIATSIRFRPATQISVKEVMGEKVFSCEPDQDIRAAIEIMLAHKVRRLPVTDGTGRLIGVLSFSDIVQAAKSHEERSDSTDIDFQEIGLAMKALCAPRPRGLAKNLVLAKPSI